MNKILRKLAGIFGASPIPYVGFNALLRMDKYLLGILIRNQHGKVVKHFYCPGRRKPVGPGFRKEPGVEPTMLRSTPFCHVVKAGFKKSVIRIHGLELVVENRYIEQPESITKRG